MAEILEESPGVRRQDLLVSVLETSWENGSFGHGEAQYMDTQRVPILWKLSQLGKSF